MDNSIDSTCYGANASGGSGDQPAISDVLSRGRAFADQLRAILIGDDNDSVLTIVAPLLIEKISETFSNAISILLSTTANPELLPDGRRLTKSLADSSGDSCKARRGCYKRRKLTSETSIRESSCLIEDGYAWRKYGQKVILNAKHPRNYFRCTHKFDQGCGAIKQVQKIQDEPLPLFKTTYFGHHTCKNNMIFSSPPSHQINMKDDSSVIWSFELQPELADHDYKPAGNNNNNCGSSDIKQEIYREEISKSLVSSSINALNSEDHHPLDYHVISYDDHQMCGNHLTDFSSVSNDLGDVMSSDAYSCTAARTHRGRMAMYDEILGI